jgi:hypothetical protein
MLGFIASIQGRALGMCFWPWVSRTRLGTIPEVLNPLPGWRFHARPILLKHRPYL